MHSVILIFLSKVLSHFAVSIWRYIVLRCDYAWVLYTSNMFSVLFFSVVSFELHFKLQNKSYSVLRCPVPITLWFFELALLWNSFLFWSLLGNDGCFFSFNVHFSFVFTQNKSLFFCGLWIYCSVLDENLIRSIVSWNSSELFSEIFQVLKIKCFHDILSEMLDKDRIWNPLFHSDWKKATERKQPIHKYEEKNESINKEDLTEYEEDYIDRGKIAFTEKKNQQNLMPHKMEQTKINFDKWSRFLS